MMTNFYYKKSNPDISFKKFHDLVIRLESFKSLKGHNYKILDWEDNNMIFERLSTHQIWKMDIQAVHRAYIELDEFKTDNFKPYLSRTRSPALGLLLSLKLLTI